VRRLRVVLEYFHPWPNSSGFHVAAAQGWYREADLDVDLRAFDPLRGDGLDYLLRREAELAVFPSNRLLVRRELGQPLQGIAAINHRALETIQTTTATGVTRPAELAGRRVALNPTARGIAMLRHLVAYDGGDPDAIEIVDSGVRELSASDIADGTVDAIFGGYWAWDVLFGGLPAERHVVWPVDEIGAPAYHSYLLGAHEDTIGGEPELLRSFLAATERGFQAAALDPELTLGVLERVMPYFPADVLAESLRLIAPTWQHDGRWGEQRDELLGPYARWLFEHGMLRSADAWIGATTNDLLPALAR
jgi:putative hydroxymethylpyrimidine transport system substrate-binding protein